MQMPLQHGHLKDAMEWYQPGRIHLLLVPEWKNEGGSWIRQVSFETLGTAVSAVMCAARVDESLRKLDIADGARIGIEPVSR